jgi:hypothetical protein
VGSIKEDDELVALLRVLLSEGHIVHGAVDTDRTARVIEKSGPTGLLMTTTEAAVDAEMETRCLTIVTDDSPEQTRRVYSVLADLEDEMDSPVDFEEWHHLQEWIASRETRAVVLFVRPLAELMPVDATRLRRDFGSLLSLVPAHAFLYQAQRKTDARGRIIATVYGDYAPVRDLVGNLSTAHLNPRSRVEKPHGSVGQVCRARARDSPATRRSSPSVGPPGSNESGRPRARAWSRGSE